MPLKDIYQIIFEYIIEENYYVEVYFYNEGPKKFITYQNMEVIPKYNQPKLGPTIFYDILNKCYNF